MVELSKAPPRIARMFDAIANRYDFLNHLLSAGLDRRWRRRAIASVHLTGRECLLDVCTGTGDLAIAARISRPPAARVVGIDFASAMLQVGRQKLAARALDGIALVRGDATQLPVASSSVDAVTIAFGIRNVERVGEAFHEMFRALRPGGRLAVLEFGMPSVPGIRSLYGWYFNRILPWIGRMVSGDHEAYEYLPASVGAFASPGELVTILRQCGFVDAAAVPLTFGIVFLYTASRGAECQVPRAAQKAIRA